MTRWGKKRKAELLKQMPIFSTCSPRELEQVLALTVPTELPTGTILTRQGAAGGIAYILASGQAEVVRDGRRLAVLGPGDVVGELSLIDGKPRSATVQARSDLEVLQIDARDLTRLLQKAPVCDTRPSRGARRETAPSRRAPRRRSLRALCAQPPFPAEACAVRQPRCLLIRLAGARYDDPARMAVFDPAADGSPLSRSRTSSRTRPSRSCRPRARRTHCRRASARCR